MPSQEGGEESAPERRARLYRVLLLKLAPLVERYQSQTVGTLKAHTSGQDESVARLAAQLRPEGYAYPEHYPQAARRAFSWIQEHVDYVFADLPFSYWLSPREVLEHRVGDDEDLAVALCALLAALGDEQARVVLVRLKSGRSHAVVITEVGGRTHVLDPCQPHAFEAFSGSMAEALQKYAFQGAGIARLLVSFNAREYRSYEEEA